MSQSHAMNVESNHETVPPPPDTPNALQVREAFAAGPQRMLDVGHSRLAYWCFGAGPHLVLVHGWPLHSATFRDLLPILARHFTCHLVDLPGAGRTDAGPQAPIEVSAHAQTLAHALRLLDLPSYALLAHDSGAVVARLHAVDNPRVQALVFGGSEIPSHRPRLLQAYMALARFPGGAQLLTQSLRFGPLRRSRLALGSCFVDPRRADGEFTRLFVDPLLRSRRAASQSAELLRTLRFEVIDSLSEAHRRIRVPSLLIWGERDTYFPVQKARAMAGELAGPTRFECLPDAGLFLHEERPEAVVRLAVDFLLEAVA